jgi:uncharacterized protein YoxC
MADILLTASLGVIAVAFTAAVLVLIPAIRQFQRTTARVEWLTIRLEEKLDPLVAQARHVLGELQRSTSSWDHLTGRLDQAIRVIDRLNWVFSGLRLTVGKVAGRRVATAAAAVEVVRRTLRYIREEKPPERPAGSSSAVS